MLVVQFAPDRGWQVNSCGRYTDVLVRHQGRWLLKSREITFWRDLGADPMHPEATENLKKLIHAVRQGG
jgi:hypothetical protein